MKIIPFPKPGDAHDEQALAAQVEAALCGPSSGEAADYWRELRADVRSLAPPISPEFERRLRERIEQREASAPSPAKRPSRPATALGSLRAWLRSGVRAPLVAGSAICVLAAIVVLALAAPWRGSPAPSFVPATERLGTSGVVSPVGPTSGSPSKAATSNEPAGAAGSADSTSSAAVAAAGDASPTRVQQLAASITLAPKPEDVQSVADQVARLAARDGGFVQSSQVRLQHGSGGEANLQLSLPTARLSAALAQLARLAPTRAQSQSLQDITDEYGAARTKLADAVAERRALLRALAKASTQGEIESLRARLSLAGGAIARARSAFQAVAKRAGNASVEVTVLGDRHAGGDRSALSTALHDAGDLLKVALAVLIVALAVLVPLALLGVLGAIAWRASRRRLRERALS
jgi:hypothetical protein